MFIMDATAMPVIGSEPVNFVAQTTLSTWVDEDFDSYDQDFVLDADQHFNRLYEASYVY